ncbi:hypothetical protein IWQ49_001034 [Labrenzia sp. EL_126]|nr:hypothetical protein [Labrenzia sp. EL_126]
MPAAMGVALDLEPDQVVSKGQPELKELQIERMVLIKDRTRLEDRLQTQTFTITRRQTNARLAQVERQLEAIEDEIETRLERDQARALDILNSIPRGRIGFGHFDPDRLSRNWNTRAQTNRQPLRPCPYDPSVGAMALRRVHSRETQILARCTLHACPCRNAFQSGYEGEIPSREKSRKTRKSLNYRNHAKADPTRKHSDQAGQKMENKLCLIKTDTLVVSSEEVVHPD